ncbi:MAG: SDR family oxidoreductase [Clostridia bacterium]|nr:SDR family oxidoreductase [Clostridia bacterium]
MADLAGRVVIVTGGSGGLGRAVVPTLAGMGARVVWTRRPGSGEQPGRGSEPAAPDGAEVRAVDVTEPDEAARLVRETIERQGGLYGVVCLVGAFVAGSAEAVSPGDWRRMLAVNLDSAFYVVQAALPHLVRQGRGRIVTVGARTALAPRPGLAAYGVAKRALVELTRFLAEDLRGTGVTANCVAPGTIDTEPNRKARPDADRRLWAPPPAIARVIGWLLSDEAGVVNGAVLPVEGPALP